MPAVTSAMQALGSKAPDFQLPNVVQNNALVELAHFADKPLFVAFICNHCPFVVHVAQELAALANEFQAKGFGVIAISSNDILNYPQDSPDKMREFAQAYGFDFPYCYDESQQVARAYDAQCTPDFFVYDASHRMRYRGQMDSARPGNGQAVTGQDLRNAMQAVLAGADVSGDQKPSIGCSIKWKSGK